MVRYSSFVSPSCCGVEVGNKRPDRTSALVVCHLSLHVGMGLVPAVGLIFGLAESKLQTEATCSLDGLKLVLCISALLVLVFFK